jgi:tetratricopeptide (TPR) repeat protein
MVPEMREMFMMRQWQHWGCLLAAVIVGWSWTGSSRASLPSAEDTRFVVGDSTGIRPLPFEEFYRRLGILMNARDERLREGQPNPDRQVFLQRVQQRGKRPAGSGLEAAMWATDLLRLGQIDAAMDILAPRLRDPRPDYFVAIVIGHLYAERGDWKTALRYHQEGWLDAQFPPQVPGLNAIQRQWWEKLDRDYVPHYYRLRLQEAELRQGKTPAELARLAEEEEVFGLFPLPERGQGQVQPVRFVNDNGQYEPGRLAASEKAKLPADALAIVQQMLFWYPGDTRLLWLLGELYAAEGNIDAAFQIFDACTWGRQYGNRRLLMEHRHIVDSLRQQQAASRSPAEEPLLGSPSSESTQPEGQAPISMRSIALYFALVGLVALLALGRALTRHRRHKGRIP